MFLLAWTVKGPIDLLSGLCLFRHFVNDEVLHADLKNRIYFLERLKVKTQRLVKD